MPVPGTSLGAADAATRELGFTVLGLVTLNYRPELEALIERAFAGCRRPSLPTAQGTRRLG